MDDKTFALAALQANFIDQEKPTLIKSQKNYGPRTNMYQLALDNGWITKEGDGEDRHGPTEIYVLTEAGRKELEKFAERRKKAK